MPRNHTANELKYQADVLGADGSTVLASAIACGLQDLTGRLREQAQMVSAETSHVVLMRFGDAGAVTESCYLSIEGVLYVVDYKMDPRVPRPKMWLEVYCHVERSGH